VNTEEEEEEEEERLYSTRLALEVRNNNVDGIDAKELRQK